jgi:catechol 2,3-dioxygenase-like lactoylglutathione lyase family enzyme
MKVNINIDVPDLEPAIAFYTAALGLTLTRVLDDDVAELTGATATIYLLKKAADTNPVQAAPPGHEVRRDYRRHWTPVHFDLVVADVSAAAARALAAGARQETGNVDWRGSRCVSFADPFGHGFCFIEFAHGETYE